MVLIARIGQKLHFSDDSLDKGLVCTHVGRNNTLKMKEEKGDLEIGG